MKVVKLVFLGLVVWDFEVSVLGWDFSFFIVFGRSGSISVCFGFKG